MNVAMMLSLAGLGKVNYNLNQELCVDDEPVAKVHGYVVTLANGQRFNLKTHFANDDINVAKTSVEALIGRKLPEIEASFNDGVWTLTGGGSTLATCSPRAGLIRLAGELEAREGRGELEGAVNAAQAELDRAVKALARFDKGKQADKARAAALALHCEVKGE